MVCFSILSCSFFNTGIDITSCRYSYSIIGYIKRANIKSYIAVFFGQINSNIAGTCCAADSVCLKRNTAAFKCGTDIVITTVTAAC